MITGDRVVEKERLPHQQGEIVRRSHEKVRQTKRVTFILIPFETFITYIIITTLSLTQRLAVLLQGEDIFRLYIIYCKTNAF